MQYNIISTGSKGNAVVLNDCIIIDCGVPFASLSKVALGLKLVLLTHTHSDHINKSTVKRLAFERPALRFACCKWMVRILLQSGVAKKNIDVLEAGKTYDYGLFQVSPIPLYHNVPNCGYRLFMGGKKAFYATDTGTLDGIEAKGYDLYLIEANYTEEDLTERMTTKLTQGLYSYELDVRNNHLSKAQCDDFIYRNIQSNGEYVYLHQHQEKLPPNMQFFAVSEGLVRGGG